MTKVDQGRQEWDRQEGETSRAYQGFAVYRDMGSARTLLAAAGIFGATHRSMINWSHKYDWIERCTAFDDWMERQKRDALISRELAEHEQKIKEFRASTEKIGKALISTAAQTLELMQQQLKEIKDTVADKREKVSLRDIPGILQRTGAIAESGSRLIAQSLGVDRILTSMAEAEADAEDD